MKLRANLIGIALMLVACGDVLPAASTSTALEPSTTGVSTAPPTTIGMSDDVVVRVIATPVQQPDGSIELCPPGMTGACPGIILEGDLSSDMLATDAETTFIEVTGSYDGLRLVPTSDPVEIDYGPMAEGDFRSLCPNLRGTAAINPSNQVEAAIGAYVTSAPDYAATWWDRESSVLTVWFASDDVLAHQQAISELAGEEPVCVAGGARYSEADLLEASQLLNDLRDTRGLPIATFGYGVGGLSNRIDLPLEELDAGTRSAIADLVGDRVVPYPYIEMIDAPLTDLPNPVPAVDGDVDILTSRVRVGGGMDALGRFNVQYDSTLNCLYFSESPDTDRTVPVWPFGYAATSDPMTVFDYDGQTVVSVDETIELGGGGVDAGFVEGNTCGADRTWIVNS